MKNVKTFTFRAIFIILLLAICVPSAFADSLGQSKIFHIDPVYDSSRRTWLIATVHYVGERAYFYVENQWWDSLSSYKRIKAENIIKNLAQEFDNFIYPELTDFFGDVWNPGIDGDQRITILMSNLKQDVGGYFDSCHEYSRSQCADSNERELIHVNANFIFDRNMNGFIAHELQHLINWNQKERLAGAKEDIWLNEMKSEFVPSLLNYDEPYSSSILERRVKDFLADFSDPLGEWKGKAGDYGVAALFGQYLANQFGENLFSLMAKNNLTGIESINKALTQAGYSEDFDQVFTNWTLANYYNNLAMGRGSKYGYTNSNLKKIHISPTIRKFSSYGSFIFSESAKDWSPRWYLLKNSLSSDDASIALKIEFQSLDKKSDFKIPYMINYQDGGYGLGSINLKNQRGISYIFNFAKDVDSVLLVPTNHSKKSAFTDNDPLTAFTLKASIVLVKQPIIISISPSEGPSFGGNAVLIKGGNFQPGINVYFGGEKAPKVVFIDETSLEVVVPSHQSGPVNVWLKNPDGQSGVFAQGYNYTRPSLADGSLIRAKGDYKVYIIQNGYKRHILDARIFDFYGHLGWANIIEVIPEERDSYRDSVWVRAANDKKVYEINGDKSKHWLNMTAEEFYASGRRWEGVFIINNQERDFYRTGADVLY